MKETLKYTVWAGLLAVLIVPYFVADTMFFPYITGKAFMFRIIIEIILGLWLVLAMKDKEFRPKWSWVLGCIGIFTFVLLIADINAVAPFKAFWSNYERMEGWVTFIHLLAYFLVLASMINREKLWAWFFRITVISPVIYVVFEYFSYLKGLAGQTASSFTLSGYMGYMGLVGDRWAGPLGNPIYMAIMTFFFACFILILINHDILNKKKERNVYSKIYSGVLYFVIIAAFCLLATAVHTGVFGGSIIWWPALLLELILGLIILGIAFRQKLFQARYSGSVFFSPTVYGYGILFGTYLYIFTNASRGVLLGFGIGLLIASLLISIFERTNRVLRSVSVVVFILMLISGFVYSIFVFRDSNIYQKLHLSGIATKILDTNFVKENVTINRLLTVSLSNVNGQARQLVWPMAIKGFQEKPLLGWGQEGFNYVFNKYYDPKMYAQEQWFDRAHNAPLDFLVAAGIFGLLAYLSLFISALCLLWSRKNTMDVTERAIITGLLVGYLFQAIFVFDNLVSYIVFFITLAYIHSRFTEVVEPRKNEGYLSNIISNPEYQNYILIPGVVILTALGVWFINIPHIQANTTLIKAFRQVQSGQAATALKSFKAALAYKSLGDSEIREQLLSITPSVLKAAEIDQETKKEFFTLTIDEVQKQIALVPEDARYYILMGSLLNNIGRPDQALLFIQKAIELSPNKQTMRFELIQTLYAVGRVDDAIAEAKKAYELETNYDRAKSLYESVLKAKTAK